MVPTRMGFAGSKGEKGERAVSGLRGPPGPTTGGLYQVGEDHTSPHFWSRIAIYWKGSWQVVELQGGSLPLHCFY